MYKNIHFLTPVARLASDSAFFRFFDFRKAWVGLLCLASALFLLAAPISVIQGVFSVFTGSLIAGLLFLALIFLAFAGAVGAVSEEVLKKAARRPPQTPRFENDLAPRFVSFSSCPTAPDLRPPKNIDFQEHPRKSR
ncbi:hypothetical protein [Halothiobacillus neapolitanus]|uniref:hypothetical protein n=1 Tax=Halothiobacillus neapolitanus TaxID=927 RepID=UPI0005A0ECA3|nr:hypothetical protein [Halothiobacillus neapolitanus]